MLYICHRLTCIFALEITQTEPLVGYGLGCGTVHTLTYISKFNWKEIMSTMRSGGRTEGAGYI